MISKALGKSTGRRRTKSLIRGTEIIENSVRPLATGRKNFLFWGNHEAAEETAMLYTFMGCCKLVEVDFRKWIRYFLSHIHEYDDDYSADLADFLPDTLKSRGLL